MKVEWISFFFFILAGLFQLVLFYVEHFRLSRGLNLNWYGLNSESIKLHKSFFAIRSIFHVFLVMMLTVGLRYIFMKEVRMAGVITSFAGLGIMLSGVGLFWGCRAARKWAFVEIGFIILGFFFLIFHIRPSA